MNCEYQYKYEYMNCEYQYKYWYKYSVSVVLYRKQPAIPFHEASVQRILRVWMRSAKIY